MAESVSRVGFFLDDGRAGELVDLSLDGRATIIGEVHGSGEIDEARAKVIRALAPPDVVFDLPQLLVDLAEHLSERLERGADGDVTVAGGLEDRELVTDVA